MAVEKKDIEDVAEALGKKFDEFKKTNDKRIDGLEEEKGKLSGQVDTLNEKLSELDELKSNLEKELLSLKRPDGTGTKAASEHKTAFMQFVRKGIETGEETVIEYRVIRQNGEIRHIRSFLSIKCDKNGKPISVLGSNLDITDAKRAEQALKESEARQHLAQKIASKFDAASLDLLVLTGVGAVYPMLRTHTLLSALHPIMGKTPLLMFFPGKYDGHSLRLFNVLGEDHYYRAFRLVPEIV